ncbi:MAG TPA: flagellar protein FliT [Methylophilus sp.]
MSDALINHYESAAKLMEQMLLAARQSAWDKVSELEQSYMLKIDVIKTLEQNLRLQEAVLSSALQQRKQVLVKKILADDGEIRQLLFPVMRRITSLIFDAQSQGRMPPDLQ